MRHKPTGILIQTKPLSKMLRALAEASSEEWKGLTKYELESRAGVARQTVYDSIPKLKRRGEIEVVGKPTISRAGLAVERYGLTDRGWFSVAILNPDLTQKAREMIGSRFDEYQERIQRSREEQLERWIELIRPVLQTRRAPPGWGFRLEIIANAEGLVRSRVQTGFRRTRQRRGIGKTSHKV